MYQPIFKAIEGYSKKILLLKDQHLGWKKKNNQHPRGLRAFF